MNIEPEQRVEALERAIDADVQAIPELIKTEIRLVESRRARYA